MLLNKEPVIILSSSFHNDVICNNNGNDVIDREGEHGDLGDGVGECNNFGEYDGEGLIKFGCELFCVFELHDSLEKEDKFENNNS